MKLNKLINKLELCSQSKCQSCGAHNNANNKCSMICEAGQTGVPRILLEDAIRELKKSLKNHTKMPEQEMRPIPMSFIRDLYHYRFPYGQIIEFRSHDGGDPIYVIENENEMGVQEKTT